MTSHGGAREGAGRPEIGPEIKVRVPAHHLAAIDDDAAAARTSRADVVRRIVANYVGRDQGPDAALLRQTGAALADYYDYPVPFAPRGYVGDGHHKLRTAQVDRACTLVSQCLAQGLTVRQISVATRYPAGLIIPLIKDADRRLIALRAELHHHYQSLDNINKQVAMSTVYAYTDNAGSVYLAKGLEGPCFAFGPVTPDMRGQFDDDARAWLEGAWEPSEDDGQHETDRADLELIATWTGGVVEVIDGSGYGARVYLGLDKNDDGNPEGATS